jgi:hypothetical protein
MCAATQRCVARKTAKSACSRRTLCCFVARTHDVTARVIGTAGSEAETSMASPDARLSSEMTVNPVRLCARRWVVNHGVAQASPLFSDTAPREVHLWQ